MYKLIHKNKYTITIYKMNNYITIYDNNSIRGNLYLNDLYYHKINYK